MQGCGMWRHHGDENCDFFSSRLSMRRNAAYRVTGCRVLNRLVQNLNFPYGETNSEHTGHKSGWDSVVSIATRHYWLDSPCFESRWGRNIPYPSRPTPRTIQASCTMGTGTSFPGVKWPGRRADHPPPSSPVLTWHVTREPLPHPNVYFRSNNIYEACLVFPLNSSGSPSCI